MTNEPTIDQRFLDALERYARDGILPGGFLHAVLVNDLMRAVAHADEAARAQLGMICRHVYNCLPATCWGDEAKVQRWIDGGYEGRVLHDLEACPHGAPRVSVGLHLDDARIKRGA